MKCLRRFRYIVLVNFFFLALPLLANDNFYEVLGVHPQATLDEIKDAYRSKARDFHPDLHPELEEALRQMSKLNEAYEVLSDESKRREYDIYRRRNQSTRRETNLRDDDDLDHFQSNWTADAAERVVHSLHKFKDYSVETLVAISLHLLRSTFDKYDGSRKALEEQASLAVEIWARIGLSYESTAGSLKLQEALLKSGFVWIEELRTHDTEVADYYYNWGRTYLTHQKRQAEPHLQAALERVLGFAETYQYQSESLTIDTCRFLLRLNEKF